MLKLLWIKWLMEEFMIKLVVVLHRYSTDKFWKAPHFEKMLYDNGQLVSLYSEALFKISKPAL